MSQFRDDLGTMIGEIKNQRPNVGPEQIKRWINWRIRQALDARTYWTDLIREGILAVPEPYTTGTISLTAGSRTVTGSGTLWPVSDVVNTTLSQAVSDIGYVEAFPSSMAGITENSILYIGKAAETYEAVPVVELRKSSFIGKFEHPHSTGSTVTQSSLAGRQLRISDQYPVFTVRAGVSSTELLLTQPWGGASVSDASYRILSMYVTLAPDLKAILAMKDDQTGFPVRLHVPVEEANYRDPRRTFVGGNPYYSLIDYGPNEQGNMLYEIWPAPLSVRQFSYRYYQQWPDLEQETDRPPWFINPSVFVYGALADAFRFRQGPKDPYYNPALADHYELRFREGLEQAKNADEAKYLNALRTPWWRGMLPGNADTWQLHDPRVMAWDFGTDLF